MNENDVSENVYVVWGQTISKYNSNDNKRRISKLFESSDHTGSPCPCSGC